jgi:hypothetical protein
MRTKAKRASAKVTTSATKVETAEGTTKQSANTPKDLPAKKA